MNNVHVIYVCGARSEREIYSNNNEVQKWTELLEFATPFNKINYTNRMLMRIMKILSILFNMP